VLKTISLESESVGPYPNTRPKQRAAVNSSLYGASLYLHKGRNLRRRSAHMQQQTSRGVSAVAVRTSRQSKLANDRIANEPHPHLQLHPPLHSCPDLIQRRRQRGMEGTGGLPSYRKIAPPLGDCMGIS